MTYNEFNTFCSTLPCTTHCIQWDGAHVWKVGGKVFAIGGWGKAEQPAFTFKTSPLDYEIFQDLPGLQPAPYLASRGMKWIQRFDALAMDDAQLKDALLQSHLLVSLGLTKKKQKELGLNQEK